MYHGRDEKDGDGVKLGVVDCDGVGLGDKDIDCDMEADIVTVGDDVTVLDRVGVAEPVDDDVEERVLDIVGVAALDGDALTVERRRTT